MENEKSLREKLKSAYCKGKKIATLEKEIGDSPTLCMAINKFSEYADFQIELISEGFFDKKKEAPKNFLEMKAFTIGYNLTRLS